MANIKVQVTIDEELARWADAYADDNYMSRSGLVSRALTSLKNQVEVIDCIKNMSLAMKKIADTGVVDDDVQKQLEDFERAAKLFIK